MSPKTCTLNIFLNDDEGLLTPISPVLYCFKVLAYAGLEWFASSYVICGSQSNSVAQVLIDLSS